MDWMHAALHDGYMAWSERQLQQGARNELECVHEYRDINLWWLMLISDRNYGFSLLSMVAHQFYRVAECADIAWIRMQ